MAEEKDDGTGPAERTRDAERTREAILVAAEDRFARLGFAGTSLQQIGEAAGVARSTPAYFFRTKQALYDAGLARAVARARAAMARASADGDGDRSAEDAVESFIGAFLDFLGRDQNFVLLTQREALEDGRRVADFFGSSVKEAAAALGPVAAKAGVSAERLLLDLAALCWYPMAHERTLLPALGMTARDPAFLEEHKRHLGDLVRAMTGAEGERRARGRRS
jgi:TetR/AcrR family transcriptional regulator